MDFLIYSWGTIKVIKFNMGDFHMESYSCIINIDESYFRPSQYEVLQFTKIIQGLHISYHQVRRQSLRYTS